MEQQNTNSVIILVLFILVSYILYSHHYQGLEPFMNIPQNILSDIYMINKEITIDSLNKKDTIKILDTNRINNMYDNLVSRYNDLDNSYFNSIVHNNPIFESQINDLELKLMNVDKNHYIDSYKIYIKENRNDRYFKCLANSLSNKYYLDSLENCQKKNDQKQHFKFYRIKNDEDYLKHLDDGNQNDLDNLKLENKLIYPFFLIKSVKTNNCLTNYNVNTCNYEIGSLKIEPCVPSRSKNQQWKLKKYDN